MPLTGGYLVQRVIRCQCGFEAIGATDGDLVAAAQEHALAVHQTEVSEDLVLALARPRRRPPSEPREEG